MEDTRRPIASSSADEAPELVVLLDDAGRPCGTAPKATVHDAETPRHLAFSLHLRRADGRILLTRRALVKRTWPGVWTNAVCGHPGPDEPIEHAINRRAERELHLRSEDIAAPTLLAPGFRYRARDASGIVENEICPVYVADYLGEPDALPSPAADEVMETAWADWEDVVAVARRMPFLLSPWLVLHPEEPEIDGALRGGGNLQQERGSSSRAEGSA